jgi:hypothetical protein
MANSHSTEPRFDRWGLYYRVVERARKTAEFRHAANPFFSHSIEESARRHWQDPTERKMTPFCRLANAKFSSVKNTGRNVTFGIFKGASSSRRRIVVLWRRKLLYILGGSWCLEILAGDAVVVSEAALLNHPYFLPSRATNTTYCVRLHSHFVVTREVSSEGPTGAQSQGLV